MIGAIDVIFFRVRLELTDDFSGHKDNRKKKVSPEFIQKMPMLMPAFFLYKKYKKRVDQ